MIEKFVEGKGREDSTINIHFKERSTVTGVFIRTPDYGELKLKNLWRIVSHAKIEEWRKTKIWILPAYLTGYHLHVLRKSNNFIDQFFNKVKQYLCSYKPGKNIYLLSSY